MGAAVGLAPGQFASLFTKDAEVAARDAGFLVNAAVPDVVRLAPPLIITEAQIDSFIAALPHDD